MSTDITTFYDPAALHCDWQTGIGDLVNGDDYENLNVYTPKSRASSFTCLAAVLFQMHLQHICPIHLQVLAGVTNLGGGGADSTDYCRDGTGYGAGGGGAANTYRGGNGAAGVVIITEFILE